MNQASEHEPAVVEESRRKFLQLAAWGGAVILLDASSRLPQARAASATDALLLSCMDFRLMDENERYMSGRGLRDKYDHVVLAGASLGAITDKYPAWNKTFWEHLDIAIKLHNIHMVVVMDHRDCGAYKVILGSEHVKDPKKERDTHAAQLKKLKGMINEKHPKLKVEMLLMALDGKVETIS
jgi:carbonic anhydrase